MATKNPEEQTPPSQVDDIQPGMSVAATEGDLGEEDVSKPKVEQVVRDSQGRVQKLLVRKGTVFHKQLEIPADRVQQVDAPDSPHDNHNPGTVTLDIDKNESKRLTAQGREQIETETEHQQENDLFDELEEHIPTTEGLRQMEAHPGIDAEAARDVEEQVSQKGGKASLLRMLGPGFLSGMAGNDASAVGAYSLDGAQVGLAHLWLMLLATPLYQAVQYSCSQIGRATGQGLGEVLRTHYGRRVAILASLVLISANVALITADLVAVSSGFELLTGSRIGWIWFVIPVALILWYLSVYSNFESIKKVFLVMSLAFVVYLVTSVLSKPAWGAVLFNTFVPHVGLSFDSISSTVALLGATISPYTIYWQMQGEKEEKRLGKTKRQQSRYAALDIVLGAVSGNLVAYCIILTAATTLFTHHKTIQTASDAAVALTPILGPYATYLFAIGFIGAGLVAIPVLLASTSYAVAGTFGWPVGLSKKPWQREGFYLILTCALAVSLVLALCHFDPITLLFWANILNGVLTPILVIYLLIIGNSRKVMKQQRLSWLTNTGLIITTLVLTTAALLLFYGLLTGQGH
ncbi:hypothetical protein KSC_083150 [Ktedonobacter sp. SOSP1-52]|uniref:NRAMP family divalent metal transporter n=1 Tax=Ktedonobacter sp. SOSP1-52 TaxID=2778366 RepID=UPI0019164A74|nr:divalent metal cation transporter [Ktedonobacter sp. SOSP1-52]GHO69423.1 hypothetical protein KSC_083150 [Ktedonobacter sp. SOSP1-52]